MDLKPINVLLVEDDKDSANLVVTAAEIGHIPLNVTIVTEGEEAIDFLKRRGKHVGATVPDLVLLDLNLPKRNGGEVLAEIKADPSLNSLAVVILTTTFHSGESQHFLGLCEDCYYTKPDRFRDYIDLIKTIHDAYWKGMLHPDKSKIKFEVALN